MKTLSRTFIPGSNWFYIKIYTGTRTADEILIQYISSIIKQLSSSNILEKWFFIRYADPDFHLRIRILLKDVLYIGEVTQLFYMKLSPLVKIGYIRKIQIDTYSRELERYGGSLIEETESIFYIDSECILSILKILKGANENLRWMIALKMIDSLLSDFSLTMIKKQELMENMSFSFKKEFGFHKYNSKQFNVKFRENKEIIESVMKDVIEDDLYCTLNKLIKKNSKKIIPIVNRIDEKLKNKSLKISLDDLLTSYLHMQMNRLFRSKNRIHELVLYDFMRRYYISEVIKMKFNE